MDDRMPLVWWYAKTHYIRSPYLSGRKFMSETNVAENVLASQFLLEDLNVVLDEINDQIREVEKEAHEAGIRPAEVRTDTHDWPMRSLLVAKAGIINAIVVTQEAERRAADMLIQVNYSPGE